jgi:hypothetical protein
VWQLRAAASAATDPNVKTDYILIGLRNSGQTPAYDLSVTLSWKEMPFGQPLPKGFDYPETGDLNSPDGSKMAVNPGDAIPGGRVLTSEQIAMVKRAKNHQATIYFYGDIKYRDVFGKQRLSPYCREYDPDITDQSLSFLACTDHNSPAIDD